MFVRLHKNKNAQLVLGLLFGICFGFLLQKGGVTSYDVIEGQLLLTDFTVLKLMLSAVIVGMAGFYLLRHFGFVQLHAAEGSVGRNVIGGLIFGVGFALLGYCPGTVAGAVGTGALDALFGGMIGLLIGAGIFAEIFPRIKTGILEWGKFPAVTVPEFLHLNVWVVVILMEVFMIGFLLVLGYFGL
ncbi:MAG: YeeE/YedE thiosulfate transporter family protein [Methanoregula sp.]|nr:YeeE/YedE thiosulfate transporter family protein [Methanoregula sp.]